MVKRQLRCKVALVLGCLAFSTLSGCAVDDSVSDGQSWAEPVWMAEARQQVEDYQLFMLNCMNEHGVVGVVALGGVVITGGLLIGSEASEMNALEQRLEVEQTCDELAPTPEVWLGRDHVAYQQMLDVRECLVSHGFTVAEPPAVEVWIEQSSPWNPYADILHQEGIRDVLNICPQVGGLVISVGEEELAAAGLGG